jgi:orotidine-5'-phosphate decarboxylase
MAASSNSFIDRLIAAVRRTATPVLVGLDPRWEQLPVPVREAHEDSHQGRAEAYRRFCCEVIDVVGSLVPAVKPQAAFFEQLGPPGMEALAGVVNYASQKGLLVVLDAKRGDIGSTAAAYADAFLGGGGQSAWGADALTVNPYLGDDSLEPFVQTAVRRGAGIFVLVRTSNPGARVFQDLVADGRPVYRHVAELVERLAAASAAPSGYGAVGAVVGATYPDELAQLRSAMPHSWFLVPGFGAQGGTAADVAAGFDQQGLGAIVNSSRAIIFAHQRDPYRDTLGEAGWQQAVEAATRDMIEQLRADTPAGAL